jgi:hypothetical protein
MFLNVVCYPFCSSVGLQDHQGNVVTPIARATETPIRPKRVELFVFDNLLYAECLLFGICSEDVIVADSSEPSLLSMIVGKTVSRSYNEVGGQ